MGDRRGFGGTQRLPRLLGLPKALDLILTGKTLRPRRALRLGLVDRVAPGARLMDAAQEEVLKLLEQGRKAPKRKLRGMARWMSKIGFLRNFIRRRVLKKLTSGQARFYEAPPTALDLCIDAFAVPHEEGFQNEARALGRLIVSPTCKGLVRLYLLSERAKRLGKQEDARSLHSALVIGGGVMGGGIAGLMASRGLQVRLCDLDRRGERVAVWRRDQEGLRLRQNRGRAALQDDRESGAHRGPARDDVSRDGHQSATQLLGREASVLRHEGRSRKTDSRDTGK